MGGINIDDPSAHWAAPPTPGASPGSAMGLGIRCLQSPHNPSPAQAGDCGYCEPKVYWGGGCSPWCGAEGSRGELEGTGRAQHPLGGVTPGTQQHPLPQEAAPGPPGHPGWRCGSCGDVGGTPWESGTSGLGAHWSGGMGHPGDTGRAGTCNDGHWGHRDRAGAPRVGTRVRVGSRSLLGVPMSPGLHGLSAHLGWPLWDTPGAQGPPIPVPPRAPCMSLCPALVAKGEGARVGGLLVPGAEAQLPGGRRRGAARGRCQVHLWHLGAAGGHWVSPCPMARAPQGSGALPECVPPIQPHTSPCMA